MVEIPADEIQAMPRLASMDGWKIVELGNKKNTSGVYREAYEASGMLYQCLDWNGLDGALALDFGKELPEEHEEIWGDADLVTNFGFTEHVYTDQEQCWANVARLSSKMGCYLAMCMPCPGDWEHHGVYQPTLAWYRSWLDMNGYVWDICSTNTNRRKKTNVIAARRVREYLPENHYMPDASLMHITPAKSRVNPAEKNCGITP